MSTAAARDAWENRPKAEEVEETPKPKAEASQAPKVEKPSK